MKRNIIIVFLVIITASFVFFNFLRDNGNPPDNNTATTGCENIDSVKTQAQVIENDISRYASSTKDIFGKSTEGGQQTTYSLEGKNRLIKQIFYSETGKSEISYYLKNGKVFHFTKKNSEYALPLSQDSSGKVKSFDFNEFYLDNNQNLCSWFSNQNIQPNTQAAQDTVNYLVSDLQ